MEEDVGDVGGLLSREVPGEGSEAAFHKHHI